MRMMMQGSPRIEELRQKFHENPRRYFAPLANEYRKAGDPEQAIAICRAHLAQQPGHMSGHVVYGQALYDAKRPDEARAVFEKALSLDPDNAIVLRQLGDIAREKGENAEARHWYARAIDADPGDNEVAAYLAELTEPVTAADTEGAQGAEAPVEAAAQSDTSPETGMPAETPPPADEAGNDATQPAEEPHHNEIAADEQESARRTTPPHEDSPFVTRTMAELYAKQGYRSAALDVYRQLALHHPDDREIMDRIEELSKPEEAETPAAAETEAAAPELVSAEPDSIEPIESNLDEEDFAFQELNNDIAFAPTAEDLNLTPEPKASDEKHFTEMEINPSGDSWDTDSWAGGFSEDEAFSPEFDAVDSKEATPAQNPETEIETPAEAETALDEAGAEPEAISSAEATESLPEVAPPVAEPAMETEAEPAESTSEQEHSVADAAPEAASATSDVAPSFTEPEVRAEEPFAIPEPEPIVAYSPEVPEDEELPHFAPKGPTVREFFATLGAKRPPDSNPITARTAVPEIGAQRPSPQATTSDFPLANDAFANMFGNEPVNEDDARAAFALSGALTASETPAPKVSTPPRAAPAQEAPLPAVPASTEESEEDIRRFREWLDGLSES